MLNNHKRQLSSSITSREFQFRVHRNEVTVNIEFQILARDYTRTIIHLILLPSAQRFAKEIFLLGETLFKIRLQVLLPRARSHHSSVDIFYIFLGQLHKSVFEAISVVAIDTGIGKLLNIFLTSANL